MEDVSFFETQPMFVCEQASLKIMDANEAACKALGISGSKLTGKSLSDFGKVIDIDELDLKDSAKRQLELKRIWKFEPADSGKVRYYQLSGQLMRIKGKPVRLIIAHEVSGLLRSAFSLKNKKLFSAPLRLQKFPLAEIEWDAGLNIVQWSEEAEVLFGYDEEEVIGDKEFFKKAIHPDDFHKVMAKKKQAYKERARELSLINRNVTAAGKTIYCEWHNYLLYDDEEQFAGMISFAQDVTHREQALEEARRSMRSYLDLFNSIRDAIYLINEDGIIVEANEGVEKVFGMKRSEVVGQHNRIMTAPGKYDEERINHIMEEVKNGQTKTYNGWGHRPNGEVFSTEFLVSAGTYYGEDVLIVVERDVSEQRESEEALRQREGLFSKLFNSSPIGIALLNEYREVEMVNDGFEQLFGYREQELKGLELDKVIVRAKDHEDAQKLTKSEQVLEVTERRVRKDGKILDVIIYAVPVVVDKQVVGIYGIYVDITERKKTEKQLRKSLKEKEMLLAEVHHRVKNNLAVITGLLDLQSYSTENETARCILKDSLMRIHSIALVHEKFYQSEDFEQVEISQYFRELAAKVHENMKQGNTDVQVNLDMDMAKLPITKAIPAGLLLNELLVNSYKHAFKNKKEGEICVQLQNNDDRLKLTVRDNGQGLPEELSGDIEQSLGMNLVETLAGQLGATFHFYNDDGAVFEFEFLSELTE